MNIRGFSPVLKPVVRFGQTAAARPWPEKLDAAAKKYIETTYPGGPLDCLLEIQPEGQGISRERFKESLANTGFRLSSESPQVLTGRVENLAHLKEIHEYPFIQVVHLARPFFDEG